MKDPNVSLQYDNETGKVTGFVEIPATVSLDASLKELASDAAKKGTERPVGGSVPYTFRLEFDNVIDDLALAAARPINIRLQSKLKKGSRDAEAFETAVNGKTFTEPLEAERVRKTSKEAAGDYIKTLTPEEKAYAMANVEDFFENPIETIERFHAEK